MGGRKNNRQSAQKHFRNLRGEKCCLGGGGALVAVGAAGREESGARGLVEVVEDDDGDADENGEPADEGEEVPEEVVVGGGSEAVGALGVGEDALVAVVKVSFGAVAAVDDRAGAGSVRLVLPDTLVGVGRVEVSRGLAGGLRRGNEMRGSGRKVKTEEES
jgi:hypothetical protein